MREETVYLLTKETFEDFSTDETEKATEDDIENDMTPGMPLFTSQETPSIPQIKCRA